MEKNKTVIIGVRMTPLDRARLDAEAKDAGTDLSKWVRVKLGIPVIGSVNSETGKVTGAFEGAISDVKTYDHVLSPAEIARDFEESMAKQGKVVLVDGDGNGISIREELQRR